MSAAGSGSRFAIRNGEVVDTAPGFDGVRAAAFPELICAALNFYDASVVRSQRAPIGAARLRRVVCEREKAREIVRWLRATIAKADPDDLYDGGRFDAVIAGWRRLPPPSYFKSKSIVPLNDPRRGLLTSPELTEGELRLARARRGDFRP